MGHSHTHSNEAAPPVRRLVERLIWISIGIFGIITLIGAVFLWPSGNAIIEDPFGLEADPVTAEVTRSAEVECTFESEAACHQVDVILTGDQAFGTTTGQLDFTGANIPQSGDKILVTIFDDTNGNPVLTFYDYQRGTPCWSCSPSSSSPYWCWAAGGGLGAIGGLLGSLMVIATFTLPAILDGGGAMPIALVTASVIAFIALFLAHGFTISTGVALLSTLLSLMLTAALAFVFVASTNLTGLTDDSTLLLGGLVNGIDPRGILLAGIVIGALGVLDDVTVTQVSAVWELKSARPDLGIHELVAPALRIGRDHISSTVNTLFLAYAGAALPLMLLFVSANQSLTGAATRELVATEIVRALVGSIGLVASVPISTWLAALVVSSTSDSDHSSTMAT